MKYPCKCCLRDYLSQRLAAARKEAGMTQAKFSELLMMDTRSYAELEHAQSFCCTLTFILYLCFCCKDVTGLVADLKQIALDVYARQSNAPDKLAGSIPKGGMNGRVKSATVSDGQRGRL